MVVAVLFTVYALTACRTVGPGDSGELAVAMTGWGVAHAPGYPLITLAGNLVTHAVPFVEPALLLNLMNALFAALACGVLARAVAIVTGSRIAGVAAGLALGTSRVFWLHALAVEVFSLNALMAALLLLLLARVVRGRVSSWTVPAFVLVTTTALTHHLTLVLLGLPVLLVGAFAMRAGARSRPGPPPRPAPARADRTGRGGQPSRLEAGRGSGRGPWASTAVRSVLAAVLGLLPLLYLPLATRFEPILSWGDVRDLRSFVELLARRDFTGGVLMSPSLVLDQVLRHGEAASPLGFRNFLLLWTDVPRSFGWGFPVLAGLGLVWAARRARPLAVLAPLFLGMLAVFFARANTPLIPFYQSVTERFFILPHVVLAFYAGCGAAWIFASATSLGRRIPAALAGAVFIGVTALPMLIVHAPRLDHSRNTFTRDFGVNLMSGMPEEATFFGGGDLFRNGFLYQQAAFHRRPDLTLVDQDLLATGWYVRQLRRRGQIRVPDELGEQGTNRLAPSRAWLDLNLRPVGTGSGSGPRSGRDAATSRPSSAGSRPAVVVRFPDETYRETYRLVPASIWSRVEPRQAPVDLPRWALEAAAAIRGWDLGSLRRTYPEGSWEDREQVFYTFALGQLAGLIEIVDRAWPSIADSLRDSLKVPALEVAATWRGARRAELLAFEADFMRQCVADSLAPSGEPRYDWLLDRALGLARASLAIDSTNVQALQTLATLRAEVARLHDPDDEVRLRRRLVEQRPGELDELLPYFRVVLRLGAVSPDRARAVRADAEHVRSRFLRLVEIGERIHPGAGLAALRAHWSRPLEEIPELR